MIKKWLDRLASSSRGNKKRKWVAMSVDRLYFEQQTDRYFMILKAAGKQDGRSVFISIGNVLDENILPALFLRNDGTKKLLHQLGVKVRKIRILKKTNSEDSAECVMKVGFLRKTVRLSTVEAVRIAAENNAAIEVPEEILRAEKFDVDNRSETFSSMHNDIFSFKFLDRDFKNNQEVIM